MLKNNRLNYAKLSICVILSLLSAGLYAGSTFEAEVSSRIKAAGSSETLQVRQETLYGKGFITLLYQTNSYKPVWKDAAIKQLREQIQGLKNDGLNPDDYWFSAIDTLLSDRKKQALDVSSAADLDMLLSETFIRAYYNLLVGKADPERLDDNFNFSRPLEVEWKKQLPGVIEKVRQAKIAEAFNQARPQAKSHALLRDALAKYRGYREAGGWSAISQGPVLKPGDRSARVAQVRARLTVTGDYTANATDPELYDSGLEDGVKHFQQRQGLDVDGVIGGGTLAAMNVSVQQRIDQLRVNLERQRWYLHENHGEFIIVDIAGYHVYWAKDDKVFWDGKAQVGKEYTQTPIFKDTIEFIEFNPTWTIPPGIMRRSILPNLKKDPDYLAKKGYLLLTQDGKEVDPKSVDWASIKTMPYIVRQPAGPTNALGLVKFMFPNKHMVYLHDTNHREHFEVATRSFSSGCVRVENPFDLAEKLLAGQPGWDRQKIDETVAAGKTKRVNLDKPMRIIIGYRTALVIDGQIYFRKDIYKRDAKVLKQLDAKFKLRAADA